jgi:flagellar biogenesis protein FliO
MDGDSGLFMLLKVAGVALLVLGLAVQQVYALKKLALKRLEKERASDTEAASAR